MPMPFDATLKDLVQSFVPDYERQFDLTDLGPLQPLNVDLSTVSAATDIVLAHGNPPEGIVDLNFQASRADDLAARVLLYNTLLHHRFRVPVHRLIVLLRPAADDPKLTGRVRYEALPRRARLDFRYEVIRLWRCPVDRFLDGGVGTVPLALLSKFPGKIPIETSIADVVSRIVNRLSRETAPTAAAKIVAASYVLSGLRVPKDIADRVFQGAQAVEESTTYQGIIEKGQVKEARRIILRMGKKKFGKPKAAVQAAIEGTEDLERLERLTDRLLTADNWQELLGIE
ncbi:MAG: DUF4351 domain-containing protein [Gemmataceae bacterium]|nr:DUF4351 domain-containing protein [Gemmataceae bacterium]MCI0740938.1 DUF4351 domain-containing protein [Gemmataceae bacterium]